MDEPEALASLSPDRRVETIDIDMNEHHDRPDHDWKTDYYWIKLGFGRIDSMEHGRLSQKTSGRAEHDRRREGCASVWRSLARAVRGEELWKHAIAVVIGLAGGAGLALALRETVDRDALSGLYTVLSVLAYFLAIAAIRWLFPAAGPTGKRDYLGRGTTRRATRWAMVRTPMRRTSKHIRLGEVVLQWPRQDEFIRCLDGMGER